MTTHQETPFRSCRAAVEAVLRDPETRQATLADAAAGFRRVRETQGLAQALQWAETVQAWARDGAVARWREGNAYAAAYLRSTRKAWRDVARLGAEDAKMPGALRVAR